MVTMNDLIKDAQLLASLANAISKAIHSGIFGAWDVVTALLAMKNVDLTAFKSEVAGLVDPAERAQVEAAFVGTLALQDATVQAKVVSSVNVLESGVQLVSEGLALYNHV